MRIAVSFVALSLGILGSGAAFAQGSPDASGAPPAAAPAPPPAGYPPPPPEGYPPPPPGYAEAPVERTANNAMYLELLGPGLFYSVNYDRTFGDFAGRVGFSYIALSTGTSSSGAEGHGAFMTVPLTISYLGIGSKKHIFELGAGATIVHVAAGISGLGVDSSNSASGSATIVLGNMTFGYRLQPPGGGFLLRAGLSPIFGGGSFIPLPYVALGGVF